ncbi:related to pyridoxamine 5`-phosphate oxidase [Fusarium mangiferae]|uniref:pyridoxal 5'-phosphate synthase n=1 Tax=Fusarium mangiferae TaxID=192010 RepID=A0A1L7T9N5_FUSMA|nr:related to pyridoxamine 5`-phosphate oxidase [Fusarium mangiferae]CVK91506.1 related to pyridoxamine 5`-phosphate oxidase [Fusarium mangiferae]
MANAGLQAKLRALPVLEGASHPKAEFASFPETPHQAFETWLDEAISANVPEPHAVTLSTVDEQGYPDARVLILKKIIAAGTSPSKPPAPKVDWTARSAMAKITAKVSRQSEPLNDPHELEAKMAEAVKSHEIEGQEPSSEGWVVYAVAPQTVEFWQASSDRLHQRLKYTLDPAQSTWSKAALWP